MVWLFCYGSNNPNQLKERLNIRNDLLIMKAFLPNSARVFVSNAATLVYSREENVLGYIADMTQEHLFKLDIYEGVHQNKYQRKNVKVKVKVKVNNKYIDAIAYIITPFYLKNKVSRWI